MSSPSSVLSSSAVPPARVAVLRLYRRLLQAGGEFSDYNFRETARRKVRERFRATRSVADVNALSALYQRGEKELRTLQRQVAVQNLYHTQPYIIEQQLRLRPYKARSHSTARVDAQGGGDGAEASAGTRVGAAMSAETLSKLQRSHSADKAA